MTYQEWKRLLEDRQRREHDLLNEVLQEIEAEKEVLMRRLQEEQDPSPMI
jgi:hypothetical protein